MSERSELINEHSVFVFPAVNRLNRLGSANARRPAFALRSPQSPVPHARGERSEAVA
jgi:hypothetical protein